MKKFPHLQDSRKSSQTTNWTRSFQATVLASWTSFSTRLESISAAKALSKMSFLIFSKAGSRSSTVLKMVATPSLKSKKNLDC